MANHISHAALPYPIRGARYTIPVPYLDADGDPTDPTTPDTEVSRDGGAFADCAEEVTTISGANGSGYITLTGAETDCALLFVAAKAASGPKATLLAERPRSLPLIESGTAQAGAAGSITLAAGAALFDLTGCFVRTTGGTGGGGTGGANNQARRITAYNASTKVASVSPNWETSPSSDTTYEILLPEGTLLAALKALVPTIPGRTLDVSAGGEAGIDWANVGSPTTAVNLSATSVKTATDVETDTQDIQSRLPAALSAVGNMLADLRAIDGNATNDNTASLKLKQIQCQNPDGPAMELVSTNTGATANGLRIMGGQGRNGLFVSSAAGADANAVQFTGVNDGAGLRCDGGSGNAHGIRGIGNGTGSGIWGLANDSGHGIRASSANGHGISAQKGAGGKDIDADELDTLLAGVTLTSAERNAVADALLDRDMSVGTDSGSATVRTVRQALRVLRNKVSVALGKVYKEDDTTESWSFATTTDAGAEPITEVDPASS